MIRLVLGLAFVFSAVLSTSANAQAVTPAGQAAATPAKGVGSQGDPDPGVHFIVIVDNPSVRILQVTLQPGAVRRQHVHNDVTFHILLPVTGTLELTADGIGTVSAVPGQAYYMVKGQPHGFTNRSAAAVQVVEVFVKPGPGPEPWKPTNPVAPAPAPSQ